MKDTTDLRATSLGRIDRGRRDEERKQATAKGGNTGMRFRTARSLSELYAKVCSDSDLLYTPRLITMLSLPRADTIALETVDIKL